MNASEEQIIRSVKAELRRIQHAIDQAPNHWDQHTIAARRLVTAIDETTLMQQSNRVTDQAYIIAAIQQIAYHEPDTGGLQDLAEWSVNKWLRLLQLVPDSVDALQGMSSAVSWGSF